MWERRQEICAEGTSNQFRYPFDSGSREVTRFKPVSSGLEPLVVEPSGYGPFLCFIAEEDTIINPAELEMQRVDTVRTYSKLLTQVKQKLQNGMYTLDRWRRILALNKKKETKADVEQAKNGGKKKKGNLKLSSIVNKILQSKTGEDCVVSDDPMSGDENDNDNDNYDVYK